MNPIIISTIIASATFIIAIFSASWLNQQHVNKLMEQIEKRFEAQIGGINDLMKVRFDAMQQHNDLRFDSIEESIQDLSDRVKRLEDILFKPSVR